MNWKHNEPCDWPQPAGVVILESEPGKARDAVVADWLHERRGCGGRTWHLQCSPLNGGIWAGLAALVDSLVPTLREQAPELLVRHGHELRLLLPELGAELGFPQSLTDTASDEEKTRNYAADRAYRCLHGLIDLVCECHQRAGRRSWSIALDGYSESSSLVHRFFTELWRRRGRELDLHLLVIVDPGRGDAATSEFEPAAIADKLRIKLPGDASEDSPEMMTSLALELEHTLDGRPLRDDELPRLIDAWRRSTSPKRALRWQVKLMARYNHDGLYEASLPYAAEVEAGLDAMWSEDPELYLVAVEAIYFSYVPLGRAAAARPIVEQALVRITDSAASARLLYLLSMLHARFLKPNDQNRAEQCLQQALAVLEGGDIADGDRHFLTVFMMNGLALVRVRQGRAEEALELCRAGIARLNEHLSPDRHRLHRSVLLFNIAQVHAQLGPYEDAIEYFSEAMAMDPNYSEYYNDRGAVYFKMRLFARAERDYLQAIELSPPYPEVWTNLGQCYRAMERMVDAVSAYSRAIDLDPRATLAIVGRGEAHIALGRDEPALADYARALTIEPDQPLVLAGRAILHFEAGRLGDSIDDLNTAIELAPELAELYQNRAVALRQAGRRDEAGEDLRSYLELCPEAEDRLEVQARLAELRAVEVAAA